MMTRTTAPGSQKVNFSIYENVTIFGDRFSGSRSRASFLLSFITMILAWRFCQFNLLTMTGYRPGSHRSTNIVQILIVNSLRAAQKQFACNIHEKNQSGFDCVHLHGRLYQVGKIAVKKKTSRTGSLHLGRTRREKDARANSITKETIKYWSRRVHTCDACHAAVSSRFSRHHLMNCAGMEKLKAPPVFFVPNASCQCRRSGICGNVCIMHTFTPRQVKTDA